MYKELLQAKTLESKGIQSCYIRMTIIYFLFGCSLATHTINHKNRCDCLLCHKFFVFYSIKMTMQHKYNDLPLWYWWIGTIALFIPRITKLDCIIYSFRASTWWFMPIKYVASHSGHALLAHTHAKWMFSFFGIFNLSLLFQLTERRGRQSAAAALTERANYKLSIRHVGSDLQLLVSIFVFCCVF